jgi:hypothetical protein
MNNNEEELIKLIKSIHFVNNISISLSLTTFNDKNKTWLCNEIEYMPKMNIYIHTEVFTYGSTQLEAVQNYKSGL